MSVYSRENKKRSSRKQTPKGKCVGVWEGLGIHLKVVPMLINTYSRAALSALVPAFSLYVYLFVLCWVDADAEVDFQESVFSLTTQVPRVEARSWDLATRVPLPDCAIFQVSLTPFLRDTWFTDLQVMEIVVVFWHILYIWASALWNHYSYVLGNNCLLLELEVSSPKFTSFP